MNPFQVLKSMCHVKHLGNDRFSEESQIESLVVLQDTDSYFIPILFSIVLPNALELYYISNVLHSYTGAKKCGVKSVTRARNFLTTRNSRMVEHR